MYDYQTKETKPWYQMTGHGAEWMNNKKRLAIRILRGQEPGYTPQSAINAAERIANEIVWDGYAESSVYSIRMHIDQVKQNLRRPLIMGEDAFSHMTIPGGD